MDFQGPLRTGSRLIELPCGQKQRAGLDVSVHVGGVQTGRSGEAGECLRGVRQPEVGLRLVVMRQAPVRPCLDCSPVFDDRFLELTLRRIAVATGDEPLSVRDRITRTGEHTDQRDEAATGGEDSLPCRKCGDHGRCSVRRGKSTEAN